MAGNSPLPSHVAHGRASDCWSKYKEAPDRRGALAGGASGPYGRRAILCQWLGGWPAKPNTYNAMARGRRAKCSSSDTSGSRWAEAGISRKEETENEVSLKVDPNGESLGEVCRFPQPKSPKRSGRQAEQSFEQFDAFAIVFSIDVPKICDDCFVSATLRKMEAC
jgi:hypothetical protein